ncbi:hypothetical protein [Cupriavidus sp. 2SB]|uniref:hypothetical protein n=1 Tax=Cupriavidus sp. 2SB TaxID=2502199 RepID=UPI0010F77BFA|nr:hypothetical protein [Cupriavidus sp. 2SB]
MVSKVMIANGNPFVLALRDALGLPATTQWFELRCAFNEAVVVRCAYLPRADDVEGFDARPLLADYRLVPTSATTQGDPAEAFADEEASAPSSLSVKLAVKVRWWVRPLMALMPWLARRAVKVSVKG